MHSKGDFADVMKLNILRWEIIPRYQGRSNVITSFLKRGDRRVRIISRRHDNGSKRREGCKEEAMSPGIQAASRSWKRQATDSPPKPP